MTDPNHITVKWRPDGHGDEDIAVTIDCTPDQTWEAITAIIATHLHYAGFSEGAALRAAIPAVKRAQHYLAQTLGGY